MQSKLSIIIDGRNFEVAPDTTVAAAVINAGIWSFRSAVEGGSRGPVCAMGVCFECRVTIDGRPHCRACMTTCRPGMEIVTGD